MTAVVPCAEALRLLPDAPARVTGHGRNLWRHQTIRGPQFSDTALQPLDYVPHAWPPPHVVVPALLDERPQPLRPNAFGAQRQSLVLLLDVPLPGDPVGIGRSALDLVQGALAARYLDVRTKAAA